MKGNLYDSTSPNRETLSGTRRHDRNGVAIFAAVATNSAEISIDPFTRVASIPANSNLASIKFESAKATKVLTSWQATEDTDYCGELQFRDPGGSNYCPYTQAESHADAYELTYSYSDAAVVSARFSGIYTFRVHFRPDELPEAWRAAIAHGKVDRAELASYFHVTTAHSPVNATAIDEVKSSFCDGNYIDGSWVNTDSLCRNQLRFKTVSVPSDFVTVHVEIAPQVAEAAAVAR
jgi:hypothetical protein